MQRIEASMENLYRKAKMKPAISFLYGISLILPGNQSFHAAVNLLISQFKSPTGSTVAADSLGIQTIKDNRPILFPAEQRDEILLALPAGFRIIPSIHILVGEFKILGPLNMLLLIS